MSPLVSVILPTYNRAGVLPRAIDSVFAQTYKNIELIVVDDGSTDDTPRILSHYGNNIKIISQKNKGVSAARNTGIRQARGDYIAFVDSDDKWLPSKLEDQIRFFQDHPNDNIALVCTDVQAIDIHGVQHERRRFTPRHASCILNVVDIFKDPYLGLPTVMIDTRLAGRDCLFDESLKSAEDIDLYLRIAVNHNAAYIHKKLVAVYQSPNSLSASLTSYDDNIRVIKRFLGAHFDLFKNHEKEIHGLMHGVFMDYARTLLWNRNNKASRAQIKEALKYGFSIGAIMLFVKTYIR